jgi:hypothetical protein
MNNGGGFTDTKAGMAGGLFCTLLSTVNSAEITKTIVLATVGAIASFGVSMVLKIITARMRRKG